MLNARQERFVQNIVKGMSQRDAYKDAYAAKYKDEAIDSKACNLFKSDKVQVRYKELIERTVKASIMSAQERKEWLTKVLNNEILEEQIVFDNGEAHTESVAANLTTKMKAMDILNKMDGEYIDRLKVSNDEDKPFKINVKVVK